MSLVPAQHPAAVHHGPPHASPPTPAPCAAPSGHSRWALPTQGGMASSHSGSHGMRPQGVVQAEDVGGCPCPLFPVPTRSPSVHATCHDLLHGYTPHPPAWPQATPPNTVMHHSSHITTHPTPQLRAARHTMPHSREHTLAPTASTCVSLHR